MTRGEGNGKVVKTSKDDILINPKKSALVIIDMQSQSGSALCPTYETYEALRLLRQRRVRPREVRYPYGPCDDRDGQGVP